MYHLIGVVYQIRRYTGVYRLLCMLLFPGLSLPRGVSRDKNAHGAGSEQPSSVVGSTLLKETVYSTSTDNFKLRELCLYVSFSQRTTRKAEKQSLGKTLQVCCDVIYHRQTTTPVNGLSLKDSHVEGPTVRSEGGRFLLTASHNRCAPPHTQCVFTVNYYSHT